MYMVFIPTPGQSLMLCLFSLPNILLLSTQVQILVIFQGAVSSILTLLIYSALVSCTPGVLQGPRDYVFLVDAKGLEQMCTQMALIATLSQGSTCRGDSLCSYCFPLLHSP